MKRGPIVGLIGCAFWLAPLVIRDKEYETSQLLLTFFGVLAVVVGTILTGVEKRRTWLGLGLSVLSLVWGLGFIIILLVPKRELQHA